MKTLFIILGLAIVLQAHATNTQALQYIPKGEIVQEKYREVKVKTPQGTIIEVEFDVHGSFEEASGSNLEKDIFIPQDGLMPLSDVVDALKKQGKSPIGDWELEHNLFTGWYYKFKGYENGQKLDYVVDAKTGKLTKTTLDD